MIEIVSHIGILIYDYFYLYDIWGPQDSIFLRFQMRNMSVEINWNF